MKQELRAPSQEKNASKYKLRMMPYELTMGQNPSKRANDRYVKYSKVANAAVFKKWPSYDLRELIHTEEDEKLI